MTDWEPATEAEAAMRDALRANDQELYFHILARTELLLPVSAEALTGPAPAGWGTWTTGGRTHVLAFTSSAALRACLGDSSAASRRSAYADLAADWPNHEWWLAVNPGLPIEGYLPAWFVSQLSRGDVRLPGRTMGVRARLEQAETVAKARASSAVPGRDAPALGAPNPSPTRPAAPHNPALHNPALHNPALHNPALHNPALHNPAPHAEQSPQANPAAGQNAAPAAPAPAGAAGARTSSRPVEPPTPPHRRSAEAGAGSPVPSYGDGRGTAGAPPGPRPGPVEAGGSGPPADGRAMPVPPEPAPTGSAWLTVPRRRPTAEPSTGGPPADPADGPSAPPASFFEPASSRSRALRSVGEPRRPADRAVPPPRFAGGSQPFPRRRPAPDPAPEQATQALRPAAPVEPPTVAFPFGPAEPPTVALPFSPAESPTVALPFGPAESPTVALPFGPAESPTVAFSATGAAAADPPAGALGPADPSRPPWPGAATDPSLTPRPGAAVEPPRAAPGEEATHAFRPVPPAARPTHPVAPGGGAVAGEDASRPREASGAGTPDELPRRRPTSGLAQAFPSSRPASANESAPGLRSPGGDSREELPRSIAEPVSGPPAPRRSFSPIVIEGTVIESRDLPAGDPVPGEADPPVAAGPVAPAAPDAPDGTTLPADAAATTSSGQPTSGAPAAASADGSPVTPPPAPDGSPSPPPAPDQPLSPADASSADGTGRVSPPPEAPVAGEPEPAGPLFRPSAPSAPAEELFRPATASSAAPAEELFRPATASSAAPAEELFRPATASSAAPAEDPLDPATPATDVPPPAEDAAPEPAPPVPRFQAANDVEENLLGAASAGSTDSFLSTLLLARVLLPVAPDSVPDSGPGDPGFVWRTEQLDGETYVVVYTSPERMADHLADPVETVRVKFVQLIRRWPDAAWSFAVNPNTPVGAKLPGEQIVALANWAAEVGLGDDAGSEPEPASGGRPAGGPRQAPPPVDPNRPVVMQKVISPSQLSYYLERGYDRVSGFVHRANELAHLNTPAQLYGALGLGYPGSPFSRDAEEIHVLRWPAHRPSLYRIPYGGQNESAMRAMEGWVIERPPFRGNGFAPGESSDVVAEFKVDSARLPHGAQLCRIGADGTERTIAVLDVDALVWRRAEGS
ncbi:SseB family protein [Micromonospora olivasterospora]